MAAEFPCNVEIRFPAVIHKVAQSATDGGIRVAFDLPESNVSEAAQLMECKRWEALLEVTVRVIPGITSA